MIPDRFVRDEIRQARRAASAVDRETETLAAMVAEMARMKLSAGQAAIPSLALGATRDITVTLTPAMPDSAYSAVATISGGANLLSSVVVQGIVSTGTSNVIVSVRATGLLSAGATLHVIAARHG